MDDTHLTSGVKLSYFQSILGPRKAIPNQMRLNLDDIARNLLPELFKTVQSGKFHDNPYFDFEKRIQRTFLSNGQFDLASQASLWVYEICSNQGTLEHQELQESNFWGSIYQGIPTSIRKRIQDRHIQLRISSLSEATTVQTLLPIANRLIQNKVPSESVVFCTSALIRNVAKSEFQRQTGYKIQCLPYFEAMTLHDNETGKRPARACPRDARTPTKKFLLLNRRIDNSPHRVALFLELLRRGVVDQGHISMTWKDLEDTSLTFQDRIKEISSFPHSDARDQLIEFGKSFFIGGPRMLPLKLDTSFEPNASRRFATSDHYSTKICRYYDDSYFSIVPEGFWNSGGDLDLDSPSMISEKVFFAMLNHHSFLIAGEPYSLARLKEYGYQTFANWWDESYDEITDPTKRIQALGQLTAELCSHSASTWKRMNEEMRPIFAHNIRNMKERMDNALLELSMDSKKQKGIRLASLMPQKEDTQAGERVPISQLYKFIGPRGPIPNCNKPTALDLIREFADDSLASQTPSGSYSKNPYFEKAPQFEIRNFASSQSHIAPNDSLWLYEIHASEGFQINRDLQLNVSSESPWSWVPEDALKLINQGRLLFVLSSMNENFSIASASEIAQGLDLDGAPANETILLTNCMPRSVAVQQYSKHTRIKLLPIPYSEILAIQNIRNSPEPGSSKPNCPRKKFLMQIRELRNHPHRVAIFLELFRRDLLKDGYVSMPYEDPDHAGFYFKDRISEIGKFPSSPYRDELLSYGEELGSEISMLLPLTIEIDTTSGADGYFKNSHFSVLNERFFKWGGVSDTVAPSHISEKTFSAMLHSHPFLIVGEPFSLARLREYGYQTFSKWWDESYDSIGDPALRIRAIADLIQSLVNISDTEWDKMKQEMTHVLQHNTNRVRERVHESFLEFSKLQKTQVEKRDAFKDSAPLAP